MTAAIKKHGYTYVHPTWTSATTLNAYHIEYKELRREYRLFQNGKEIQSNRSHPPLIYRIMMEENIWDGDDVKRFTQDQLRMIADLQRYFCLI